MALDRLQSVLKALSGTRELESSKNSRKTAKAQEPQTVRSSSEATVAEFSHSASRVEDREPLRDPEKAEALAAQLRSQIREEQNQDRAVDAHTRNIRLVAPFALEKPVVQ